MIRIQSRHLARINSLLNRHGLKGLAVTATQKTLDEARRRWVEFRLRPMDRESWLHDPNSETTIGRLSKDALTFTENLRLLDAPYGRYRYSDQLQTPVLYASTYAALLRHLLSDLDELGQDEKAEWAGYIQSFQSSDGLFRDPAIDNEFAESGDSWGWRHLTIHALAALAALDESAKRGF